jgi:hypothetical protein
VAGEKTWLWTGRVRELQRQFAYLARHDELRELEKGKHGEHFGRVFQLLRDSDSGKGPGLG